jgi:diacylglycerol kinase (ATP)
MVKRQIQSFDHAFRGLGTLVKTQNNARIHLAATVCVAVLGILLEVSIIEWAILVLASGLVWTAEALNTAIEFLADRVAPERHELVKMAKDTAAGGVLAASIAAALAGLCIFLPHIL